jgi:2-isopropylmalate synthase
MMSQVIFYDTTLRDGMQGTGINYTLEDKILIAHKLDEIGIDYVEGGFPLSNEKEAAFFEKIKNERFEHAKIVPFGSTRKPGSKASTDPFIQSLLNAGTECVMICGKAWTKHVTQVLKTDLEENLEMIFDSISILKKEGKEVFFDLEHFFDGYKDSPDYALKVLKTGTEAGSDTLILCDTNGGTLPHEVEDIINDLPEESIAPLGVHFHNDTGTAVANTLVGIKAGAMHVQGTINGWGERCGNANLCVLIPNVCLKMGLKAHVCSKLSELTSLSRYIAEMANIIPDNRQPYVGDAAFSHKAGQHADVVSKAPGLIEHIDGKLVGNHRKILLSELASRSTIVEKLSKYGRFDKASKEVKELTNQLKKLENKGYEYEAAEASFDMVIRKTLKLYKPLFELHNYYLESYKYGEADSKTVGRIFLRQDGTELMGASVRIGPVDTLDAALRDALQPIYPFIKHIKLIDYRVRILNPQAATGAKVRVFITSYDGEETWDTVGVSENIIEASWEAIVDSLEYYYNNFVIQED